MQSEEAPETGGAARPPGWVGSAAVLGLSALVYVASLSGGLTWDDHNLIGPYARGGGARLLDIVRQPLMGYYRPAVTLSFYAEHFLWRGYWAGYHVTNVLLHVLATGVLLRLFRLCFGSAAGATTAGLLFAVQPAQVGAVAWIGGRTDALSVLWVALFSLLLLRVAQTEGDSRLLALAGAALAYLAALFTKEQAVALLPVVPLALYWLRGERPLPSRGSGWSATIPFALATLFYVSIAAFVASPRLAAAGPDPSPYLVRVGQTLAYYASLLLAPSPRWMQTLSLSGLEGGAWVTLGWVSACACAVLVVCMARRQPAVAWFLVLAAVWILPVSNLAPLPYLQVAPYRAAVTGFALVVPLGWGLARLPRPATVGALSLLAVWWGALTLWGEMQWRGDERFFSAVARYDPGAVLAHYNLASVYQPAGRNCEAAAEMEAVLQLLYGSDAWRHPEAARERLERDARVAGRVLQNQDVLLPPAQRLAVDYYYLGWARLRCGQRDQALAAFRAGTLLDPAAPQLREALRMAQETRGPTPNGTSAPRR